VKVFAQITRKHSFFYPFCEIKEIARLPKMVVTPYIWLLAFFTWIVLQKNDFDTTCNKQSKQKSNWM